MNKKYMTLFGFFCVLFFSGCATANKAEGIDNFNATKYLGKWDEVARLDFRFERNLNNTTAEYSLLDQNRIRVVNKGFNYTTNEWKEAIGKAKFKGADTKGELLVSFFGPFYGAYNIIALDDEYQYALIAGKSTKYLWILSRTKEIPDHIKTEYLIKAQALGYDVQKLIWVEHTK